MSWVTSLKLLLNDIGVVLVSLLLILNIYSTLCSNVSIANFEHVNDDWKFRKNDLMVCCNLFWKISRNSQENISDRKHYQHNIFRFPVRYNMVACDGNIIYWFHNIQNKRKSKQLKQKCIKAHFEHLKFWKYLIIQTNSKTEQSLIWKI